MNTKKSCKIGALKMIQWYNCIKKYATKSDNSRLSEILKRFPVNATDNLGNTLLHYITKINSYKFAKNFIDAGFDVNAKNDKGEPVIAKAILNNNEKIVKLLISSGAIIDNEYFIENSGPLHLAAKNGCVNMIKILLDAGCDVNAKNKNGITPLVFATNKNKLKVLKVLLAAGALCNGIYFKGDYTPLHIACMVNHPGKAQLLLQAGCSIAAKDHLERTPLHLAIIQQCPDLPPNELSKLTSLVKILIQAGAKINAKDIEERTPLHWAAELGFDVVVDLLLKAGAKPNAVDSSNNTPLHLQNAKHVLSAKRLIEAGAKINKLNFDYRSCVFFSVRWASVELLNLLIQHGANLKLIDQLHLDALGYALLRWGCDNNHMIPDFEDSKHRYYQDLSDYMYMEYKSSWKTGKVEEKIECIKILCKHGVDINRVNQKGMSPLEIALLYKNDPQIINALLRQGAVVNFENRIIIIYILLIPTHSSKLSQILIRHTVFSTLYKQSEGIINFDFEKLNEERKIEYANCEEELKNLNDFKIHKSTPLFNLIEGSVKMRDILNERLLKLFENGDIAKRFPIFNDVLTDRFEKERKKFMLINEATEGLQNIIQFNKNSFSIIYRGILRYLNDKDKRIVASFANLKT